MRIKFFDKFKKDKGSIDNVSDILSSYCEERNINFRVVPIPIVPGMNRKANYQL